MNDNDNVMTQRRLRTLWAFAAVVPLLSGCGGGGSSDDASATGNTAPPVSAPGAAPSPSPPAPSPAPAPAPVPAADVLSTCGLSDFSGRILLRINQLRASGATCGSTAYPPAAAVAWNAKLTQAADGHSQDMAARDYFDHTSVDGRTFDQRISATGYSWSSAGENIAAGYSSVDAVMDGWTRSAGHCANLMKQSFTEIGVACVPGTTSTTYRNYWTMDLAKPR